MDNIQLSVMAVAAIAILVIGGGFALAFALYQANRLIIAVVSAPRPDLVAQGGHKSGLGQTMRRDRWWVEPLWTGLGFLSFVVYANWAAFQGASYWYGSYLSPLYSPVLFVDISRVGAAPVGHAWFGVWPEWISQIWPPFFPTSPAWLILAGPLAFRLTCYYYRKFYYRSYFMSPPACAVGAFSTKPVQYKGETSLFIFHNLHRYTWYVACGYIAILSWDAFVSFWESGDVLTGRFGVGVGSIVLLLNPILLAAYTFGCHSCRHLVGGGINRFSGSLVVRTRFNLWKRVTWLNQRHMLFAWLSMVWVGFADFYVRACSLGIINDINTW